MWRKSQFNVKAYVEIKSVKEVRNIFLSVICIKCIQKNDIVDKISQ